MNGPRISAHQEDLFESDASIIKRQERLGRKNYTAGIPIEIQSKLLCSSEIFSLNSSVHSDKQLILVGDASGTVHLLNLENGTRIRKYNSHKGPVSSLAVLPSKIDPIAITGCWDKGLRFFSVSSGKLLHVISEAHSDYIKKICVLSESEFLTSSVDKSVRKWKIDFGVNHQLQITCTNIFLVHKRSIEDMVITNGYIFEDCEAKFSSKEPYLLTASSDCKIKFMDLTNGEHLHTLEGHMTSVYCIDYDATVGMLISGSADELVIEWDLDSKVIKRSWNCRDWIKCCRIFDHRFIFAGSRTGYLYIIDINEETYDTDSLFKRDIHCDEVSQLIIWEKTLISISLDGTARRWDLLKITDRRYCTTDCSAEIQHTTKIFPNNKPYLSSLTLDEEAELELLLCE